MTKLVLLGSARKAHGLKGHALFYLGAGSETHLKKGDSVILRPLEGSELPYDSSYEIEEIFIGNDIRVKLVGVIDRTALEKIMPFEIYVPKDSLPALEEGEFYITDLLGLNVVDEEGERQGIIYDVYETPAQTVFIIKMHKGGLVDVPYVPAFFKLVDLENEKVHVLFPEEME